MSPPGEDVAAGLVEDIEKLSITEHGATHIKWHQPSAQEQEPREGDNRGSTTRKMAEDGTVKKDKKVAASYVPPRHRKRKPKDKNTAEASSTAATKATAMTMDNANPSSAQSVGSHLNAHARPSTTGNRENQQPGHRYNTRAAESARREQKANVSPAETASKALNERSRNTEDKALEHDSKKQTNLRLFERIPESSSEEPRHVSAAYIRRRNNRTATMEVMQRPAPSSSYLNLASKPLDILRAPRKLLVVLDLNGTLLFRKRFHGTNNFIARPRLSQFLDYLFANHRVMVWSSARPQNVEAMCSQLFTEDERAQLVAIRARDTLHIPPKHYDDKVQVYKQLLWLWNDSSIQATSEGGDESWGQHNTVLIDDSIEKAASEPHNLVQLDEFEAREDQMHADVLSQVETYLEQLRWQENVSSYMRLYPFQCDVSQNPDAL